MVVLGFIIGASMGIIAGFGLCALMMSSGTRGE